jgi:hypothetical protein|tara:strand:- start:2446 stop:2640 length:195 start_codon:yes stop_codon:yes gene_type:complete
MITVFDVLNKQIAEQISAAEEHLGGGAVKDYADYREVVGLIRGLKVSLSYVNDLSQNFMEQDDD